MTQSATIDVDALALQSQKQFWEQVLLRVRERVNDYIFNTWFLSIHFVALEDFKLIVEVHDRFTKDWISDHYASLILEVLASIKNDVPLAIKNCAPMVWPEFLSIQVNPSLKSQLSSASSTLPAESVSHKSSVGVVQDIPKRSTLNERYVFSNFVEGASNQFAFAACQAVADKPAQNYSPLFLFGGVGLGKTHLMHAIGHSILKKFPHYRVIYVSSEEFMNEVVNGIRYGKMDEFHQKYRRHCDVLLVDDIQMIVGRERTQEEFFHTFNTLHESKRQIVISSDKLPHEIPGLEDRLRTRFQWGLIADIQPPEIETRIAILKKKAELESMNLADDVCLFLAENIRSNVRELEGALIRLIAHASMTRQPITLEYSKRVLSDLLANRRQIVTIESIQKTVAHYYNIKVSDLKSQRRHKTVAKPRQVAMYLCRKVLQTSYPELGERFGGKDHTTILSACRKMENMQQKDDELKKELGDLMRKIEE